MARVSIVCIQHPATTLLSTSDRDGDSGGATLYNVVVRQYIPALYRVFAPSTSWSFSERRRGVSGTGMKRFPQVRVLAGRASIRERVGTEQRRGSSCQGSSERWPLAGRRRYNLMVRFGGGVGGGRAYYVRFRGSGSETLQSFTVQVWLWTILSSHPTRLIV